MSKPTHLLRLVCVMKSINLCIFLLFNMHVDFQNRLHVYMDMDMHVYVFIYIYIYHFGMFKSLICEFFGCKKCLNIPGMFCIMCFL